MVWGMQVDESSLHVLKAQLCKSSGGFGSLKTCPVEPEPDRQQEPATPQQQDEQCLIQLVCEDTMTLPHSPRLGTGICPGKRLDPEGFWGRHGFDHPWDLGLGC